MACGAGLDERSSGRDDLKIVMKFEAFERAARAAYEDVPDPFKEGIDGLVVSREAIPHPEREDVYTLGECLTEEHRSDYGSPETTRSVIALYWGSFRELARTDEDFDWEGELWETLTHELRHHLESLAGDDALDSLDYAVDETFKRDEGLDFDPWYFQSGEEIAPSVYQVEKSVYIEQAWGEGDFLRAERIEFDWEGVRFGCPRPDELGDVHFVWIEGIDRLASLEVVLVRKRTWLEDAKRLVGTYRPVVLESKTVAEPLTDGV